MNRIAAVFALTTGILASVPCYAGLDLYATSSDSRIFKIDQSGVASTFGIEPANNLFQIAFDRSGILYGADVSTGNILRYGQDGSQLSPFVTGLAQPIGLTFDTIGNLYVSEQGTQTIEKFSSNGVDLGVFARTQTDPWGLTFDSSGNLYVANSSSNTVQRFDSLGNQTAVLSANLDSPRGLAFDAQGNSYVSNALSNTIERFSADGTDLGVFASAGLAAPIGLAFDGNGNLYVASNGDRTTGPSIREFAADGTPLGIFNQDIDPIFLAFGPPAVVPEPASVILFVLGIIIIVFFKYINVYKQNCLGIVTQALQRTLQLGKSHPPC